MQILDTALAEVRRERCFGEARPSRHGKRAHVNKRVDVRRGERSSTSRIVAPSYPIVASVGMLKV